MKYRKSRIRATALGAALTRAQKFIDRLLEESKYLGYYRLLNAVFGSKDAGSTKGIAKRVDEALRTLTIREERTMRLRFGLDGGGAKTLTEVGEGYGITRERVRQIEGRAIRKMRDPFRQKIYFRWMRKPAPEYNQPEERIEQTNIEELGLPLKVENALKQEGVNTVRKIKAAGRLGLRRINNIGPMYVEMIMEAIRGKN